MVEVTQRIHIGVVCCIAGRARPPCRVRGEARPTMNTHWLILFGGWCWSCDLPSPHSAQQPNFIVREKAAAAQGGRMVVVVVAGGGGGWSGSAGAGHGVGGGSVVVGGGGGVKGRVPWNRRPPNISSNNKHIP